LVGKIQVVQIRRVLLLFALVLGLSAVVASIAPPPDDTDEQQSGASTMPRAAAPPPSDLSPPVRFTVRRGVKPVRRVRAGSSFSLSIRVPEPGDVVLEALGLRQTAVPLSPAHFDLLASPPGRHSIDFVPVTGGRRVAGWLEFVEPATVTRRPHAR
jgi:hypothetical protein